MRTYLLLLAVAATALQADTLNLRDGRTVNGRFLSATSTAIRFAVDGRRTQSFPVSSVANIAFDNGQNSSTLNQSGSAGNSSTYNRAASATSSRSRTSNLAIPTGTVVTVRTIDPINSDRSDVGQTFAATLDEPIVMNGRTVAPKGADAKIRVVQVNQQSGLSGSEEISLALDQVTMNGRTYQVVSNNAEIASKNRNSESVKVVGGTAVLGAVIGAIAGGGKGAAIGAASGAGAGAAIQAIRGQRVQIPAESVLDFQLTEAVPLDR